MTTREKRGVRGRRRGDQLTQRLVDELRTTRVSSDVSQRVVAAELGWSQSEFCRFENRKTKGTSIGDLSAVAAVLGMELSAGLHPAGEPIRDKGHQQLINRFRALLSPAFRVSAEVPLPTPGDRRSWDLLLRLPAQLTGVEAETRIREFQRLVRHVHQRERDGGVDQVILLLAATRTNRELVDELRVALGAAYATSPRRILGALRAGQALPGSGIVLL